jgi:transposase
VKGIEYLTALSIVSEVGDFRRFGHAEAFMAYLGLVPREFSSGEKRRQGGITKSGNTHLRNLLIESSWHYRYKSAPSKRLTKRREGQPAEIIAYADKAMMRLQGKFFRLILKGKMKQAAVTAVARELAGFVWGMMVGQTA